MNDTTHTTTTTTSDTVIAVVIAKLRDRLKSLDAETRTLDAERIRIQRALSQLADEVPLPVVTATALQQVAEAGQTIKAIKIATSTNGKQAPLQHVIHELLIADGPMKPTAIASTLLAYGYQTKANHFTQVVYMALKKFKGDLFEQTGDGHWQPATARKRKAAR